MKLINPNAPGFVLSDYMGAMLRSGIRELLKGGPGAPFADLLATRYTLAKPTWIKQVVGQIGAGIKAAGTLIKTAIFGPPTLAEAPVVPVNVFPTEPSDRLILVGTVSLVDKQGNVTDRWLQTMGASEFDALGDVIGKSLADLIRRIAGTDPAHAADILDSIFEAHWLGRKF